MDATLFSLLYEAMLSRNFYCNLEMQPEETTIKYDMMAKYCFHIAKLRQNLPLHGNLGCTF